MSDQDTYDLAPAEPHAGAERPHTQRHHQPRSVVTCPQCKYDLRGSSFPRCPECGLVLTTKAVERASQNVFKDVYLEPLVYIAIGLSIASAVAMISGGAGAVVTMLIGFGIMVGVGWVIFIGASALWIGFDQPLHTTAVQLTAAYAGTVGTYTILNAIIPAVFPLWMITWIISLFVLVGLLSKLLYIDTQDAVWIAMLTWISLIAIALFL